MHLIRKNKGENRVQTEIDLFSLAWEWQNQYHYFPEYVT